MERSSARRFVAIVSVRVETPLFERPRFASPLCWPDRGEERPDRLRVDPCFPEASQVVLPGWRLECGLLLVRLQGSIGPQTPQRGLSLWASSMRSHGMSGGCDVSCAHERRTIPTTEESKNT